MRIFRALVDGDRSGGGWPWRSAPYLAGAGLWTTFVVRSASRSEGSVRFSLFDDAMISMRYGRNLAEGHGLLWNPGGPAVEGFTNPLWTIWMALLHRLGLSGSAASLAVMVSSGLLLLATMFLVARIAEHLAPGDRVVAGAALWMTALSYPLAYWSLRGMEVGLVAFLVTAMVLLALRAGPEGGVAGLAVVMVLAVVTRLDLVVPAVVVGVFTLVNARPERRWRVALVLGGALAGCLAAQTLLRLGLYDDVVPNTYHLKVAGVAVGDRLHRGLLVLAQTVRLQLLPLVVLAVLSFVGRSSRGRRGPALLAAVFLGQCAYSTYVGGDAWEWFGYPNRYFAAALPVLGLLAALGMRQVLEQRGRVVILAPLAALAVIFLLDPSTARGRQSLALASRLDLAQWVVTGLATLAMLVVAYLRRHPPDRHTARALGPGTKWRAAAVTAVALAGANAVPVAHWASRRAYYVADDSRLARLGVALREATDDRAVVAVVGAGTVPYFNRRPSVDLLGKSDRFVARSKPRAGAFVPGHTKWDYDHSVGRLRPDVVAQLWAREPGLEDRLRSWGYVRLGPELFARAGSPHVDWDRLARVGQDRTLAPVPERHNLT